MRSRTTPQTAIRAQALAGATWALVLVAGTPTTARADDPPDSPTEIDVDLAIRANDVHQMYCAELYAPDVQRAAEGYQTVGETWGEVDARHEATGEVYWLYWRGLMAECLGQYDQAQGDLHAFLDAHGETPAYAELVKDARRRVTRIQDVNTGDTTRAIGRRRAAIAFLEDPRAEQTLGRIELRRYRNSGLTLDEWTGRRFSLKRRVVFTWTLGAALGPLTNRHTEVRTLDGQSWVTADSLVPGWYFRSAFGFEAWPTDALSVGLLVGIHTFREEVAVVQVEDMEQDLVLPEDYRVVRNARALWDGRIWVGVTPLPLKLVKPVFRAGLVARFRRGGEVELDNQVIETHEWIPIGVGAYLGVLAQSSKVFGLDLGVWVSLTPKDTHVDTNLETAPPEPMRVIVKDSTYLCIRPGLTVRFAL